MEKSNLITFFIVGKSVKDREFKMIRLDSSTQGWNQASLNTNDFNVSYVSNENISSLLEWFKCDFSSYRMFELEEDARKHLILKTSTPEQINYPHS